MESCNRCGYTLKLEETTCPYCTQQEPKTTIEREEPIVERLKNSALVLSFIQKNVFVTLFIVALSFVASILFGNILLLLLGLIGLYVYVIVRNDDSELPLNTTLRKRLDSEPTAMPNESGTTQHHQVQTNVSYFDGGLLSYIGHVLIGTIVTIITLGIAYPWAVTLMYGWKINHTVIGGRRLRFTGTALGLFGHWILWWVLTVITFGIFGFWVFIKVIQWKTKHTRFLDELDAERHMNTLS